MRLQEKFKIKVNKVRTKVHILANFKHLATKRTAYILFGLFSYTKSVAGPFLKRHSN